MVPNPRPVGQRIRVDRTPALPGAPRERRIAPLRNPERLAAQEAARSEDAQRNGVNADGTVTWGPAYRGVTSRKALKRPAWRSNIAGGQRIESAGV